MSKQTKEKEMEKLSERYSSLVSKHSSRRIPHYVRVRVGAPPKLQDNYCVGHIYNCTEVESRYDSTLGRIVRVKVKKRIDVIKELSSYRMSDFLLENQIESGSIKNLVPVSMTGDMSIVESSVSAALDALERSIPNPEATSSDYNNNNNNNNNN